MVTHASTTGLAKTSFANTALGLSSEDAAQALAKYGENGLPEPPLDTLAATFGRQFKNPFIYILGVAAIASLALGQIPSAVFIVAVLLINAGIGTVQEYSAQKSAAALRRMVRGRATVIRDGVRTTIDSTQVVPGDCLIIEGGDKIAADVELDLATELLVDESMLTGESVAVAKLATGDNRHLYAGTIAVAGTGQGQVIATGTNTEIGRIAGQVAKPKTAEPPLTVRVRRFTHRVAFGILLAIAALIGVMILRGSYAAGDMVLMAVGLAVSAIPEGLPAALTVALAIGMNRMAAVNVIIRRLVAVEALGSCTFICSDKTGTLTVNELTAKRVLFADGSSAGISGEGLDIHGSLHGLPGQQVRDALWARLFLVATRANDAALVVTDTDMRGEGDTVDVAFLVLAEKIKSTLANVDLVVGDQLDAIPYASERGWSASLNEDDSGGRWVSVKGATENVMAMCSTMVVDGENKPIDKAAISARANALARQGYRVLALADGVHDSLDASPSGLTFLGVVGMIDPLRPDAAGAVARCHEAHIDVAMITGDHPETARTIALELGIIDEHARVLTGLEIQDMNAADLEVAVDQVRVFARIRPEQKQRIVECLIASGHYVAVTGDGVNDAPALRHANVGIAMGLRGTDVARETADIILTDDKFASIVAGIEQGRIVYANIRKVIALLISTGCSAILLFFLCALSGLPMPMTAVQLLWLNLVANGVQDVALAFEPKEGDELQRPPREPSEPILERHMIQHIATNGIWMGVGTFVVFDYCLEVGMDIDAARNVILMLMILFGNIHALNTRSETRSLFKMSIVSNPLLLGAVVAAQSVHISAMHMPWISNVLGLQPIAIETWFLLAAVAASLIIVDEVAKWMTRRHMRTA